MAASVAVVETRKVQGQYDLVAYQAIIDHSEAGRLLLTEGYGGEDSPEGGAYRWRHGLAARLKPSDTLAKLEGQDWNPAMSHLQAVLEGSDPERPVLALGGLAIQLIARAAGLLPD